MRTFIQKIIISSLFLAVPTVHALPNPASVNCIDKHHQLFLIQETGICVFADNSYCEEWSYLRNECKPGQAYWPEEKIEINNLQKYCVAKDEDKFVLVKLCKSLNLKRGT